MEDAAPSFEETLEASPREQDRLSMEVMGVKIPLVDEESEDLVGSYASSSERHSEESPKSAFQRLPDEIILQILQLADSNGFASLAILNSKWRSVSQQADLYALHLANCPSFAMGHNKVPLLVSDEKLPELRKLFAREVKRNLFEAYLRPNKTNVRLISTTISSSSCPGGEGIQFSPSPRGHHVLAYNSSRIYVLDVTSQDIQVKREFKILRRPAATCIKDDGTLLAVLLTEMQVDVYDLTQCPPKRTQSIMLDHSPRAIALSPCGSVLAAAYEGGIEVSALSANASGTERRAVKCDAVDALAFSSDGTQILGTTVHSSQPNTVILTAPYYDASSHMRDVSTSNMSALWTTSILFPNTSRDCSHAVFIQEGNEAEASWTFTYDRSFETFRAVRIGDLRNGTTYFTGPSPSLESEVKLIPCTLPAASYRRELVSAGFRSNEIWLYGVPDDLNAVPQAASTNQDDSQATDGPNRSNSGLSVRPQPRPQQDETQSARVPQWQIMCDKLRNNFVSGYRISELAGVTMVKWVAEFEKSLLKERLVVAAPGLSPGKPVTEAEGIDFEDGGRLTLLDFDYRVRDGETREMVIEVGTKEPETLEEEHRDLATEVAILRRRTVALNRASRVSAMYAATTPYRYPRESVSSAREDANDDGDDPLVPRRTGMNAARGIDDDGDTELEDVETQSAVEEQEALDAPYAHASPRSGNTLRRAATAVLNSRRLHPEHTMSQYEYRRADGRLEHPHESDADNWVPPPPPYQRDDPGDVPAFLRHALETGTSLSRRERHQSQPPNATTGTLRVHARSRSTVPMLRDGQLAPLPSLPPMPRSFLEAVTTSQENMYDVSPPDSPTRVAPSVTPAMAATPSRRAPSLSLQIPAPLQRYDIPSAASYPPPPRSDQLASPNRRSNVRQRRLSGGLNLSSLFSTRRVTGDFTTQRSLNPSTTGHVTMLPLPPLPVRERGRSQQRSPLPTSEPTSVALHENMSLIGSTGARGSLDQPVSAPHPRPHTQPAVPRPMPDRLETIRSRSSGRGGGQPELLVTAGRISLRSRNPRGTGNSSAESTADATRRGWPGQRSSMARNSRGRHGGNDADAGLADVTSRGVLSLPSQPSASGGSGGKVSMAGMRTRLSIQEKVGRCVVM